MDSHHSTDMGAMHIPAHDTTMDTMNTTQDEMHQHHDPVPTHTEPHHHDHGHGHGPGHHQDHGHGHGHHHGHGHDHKHAQPQGGDGSEHQHGSHAHAHPEEWDGIKYLARPGVKEVALVSVDSVTHALKKAGLAEADMSKLHMLEVGCGPGPVTGHYASRFASVHGIDLSPSMLLALSGRLPEINSRNNITYSLHALSPSSPKDFQGPLPSPTQDDQERKLTPPRSQFDIAVLNLVLHHVDKLDSLMNGLRGMLRSGGYVVLTEFGKEEGGEDVVKAVREQHAKDAEKGQEDKSHPTPDGKIPHIHHGAYTPGGMKQLLEKYGFTDVQTEIRGTLPVWEDKPAPPCLIALAKKP